jgi:uncharacterized iron-regulated protein
MHTRIERAGARALSVIVLSLASIIPISAPAASCPQPAQWLQLRGDAPRAVSLQEAMAQAATQRVVLLGESHDNAEHHRWQLHVLAALHAQRPDLALGLEMFPRRLQPVLDRWSAGALTESEFLEQGEWDEVWAIDAALYMPLFHYARMHRIPMLALNVERQLVREVGSKGWESVPMDRREGVDDPAAPADAYLGALYEAFVAHGPAGATKAAAPTEADLRNPQFVRFVQSMQVWDRAMARGIAEHLARGKTSMVVGIMGSGHLRDGFGVPHQLRALGVSETVVMLPWESGDRCEPPGTGSADYLFGVASSPTPERPRLGVMLDNGEAGVVVREVVKDSIAERAGMKQGDVVTTVAGTPVTAMKDVIAAVQRQAPGTWLPVSVRRGTQTLELIARFPASR